MLLKHVGNCDLCNLSCHTFVEKHRHNKKGGGVGIYIKHDISFQDRNDLYSIDGVFESFFIEIDKHVFKKDKKYCAWGTI